MWCKFPELKRQATVWFLERVKAKYIQEVTTTRAKDRMTLIELLRKSGNEGDVDFLREGVEMLAEAIMELEIKKTGAELHERSDGRMTYRNGCRQRIWASQT